MSFEKIEVNGKNFEAEVADNFYTRAKGLSFRSEGKMLFKFSRDTTASIDMMLLSRPLYLYFMDSEGEVIDVQTARPWGFDPRTWKVYSPDRPYRFLLESFEELDVEEGDSMEFSGTD
ncbi:MAG: DUF192 domain-containing protein [Candidatus Nanohalobium sp.]